MVVRHRTVSTVRYVTSVGCTGTACLRPSMRTWRVEVRRRALIVAACLLLALALAISGDAQRVTVTGRVSATDVEASTGQFAIVGDDEPITLVVPTSGYLIAYLSGSNGKAFTVTLEPK
jgi:hypothetical protein